jgi:hypothetical protein
VAKSRFDYWHVCLFLLWFHKLKYLQTILLLFWLNILRGMPLLFSFLRVDMSSKQNMKENIMTAVFMSCFQSDEQRCHNVVGEFQHDWTDKPVRFWQYEHDTILECSIVHSLSHFHYDCTAQYAHRYDGELLPTNRGNVTCIAPIFIKLQGCFVVYSWLADDCVCAKKACWFAVEIRPITMV